MGHAIAALGDRDPTYVTHRAIDATIAVAPQIRWVATDDARIDGFDGLWVLPGTPYRDEAGVHAAIRFAREQGMPILGTCGGFQHMAVEFARNVAGILGAVHGESSPDGEAIVVAPLACSLVGEERTVVPVPGTRLAEICGEAPFTGFHWCGYGLAPGMAERLVAAGLVIGAHADDAGVEAFELPDHRFYVATLFQPQVSAPLHQLVGALLEAATRRGAGASLRAGTPS